jgi:hypothetical protein
MVALPGEARLRWAMLLLLLAVACLAVERRVRMSGAALHARGELRLAAQPRFVDGAFRVAGTFREPLGDLGGYVLTWPGCAQAIGVLPVPASYSAISPAELRWEEGAYRAQYVHDGIEHSGRFVGLTLTASDVAARALTAFGMRRQDRSPYYLKVWVPSECPRLSEGQLRTLERGLSEERR